jgi:hypothetical protein
LRGARFGATTAFAQGVIEMKVLIGSLVAAALFAAPIASIASTTIGIDNHYSAVLDGFYLQAFSSGHSASDWSDNMLNDTALGSTIDPFTSDDSAIVNMNQDTCDHTYNIRAHWADGSTKSWYGIDFCQTTPNDDFTSDADDFWAVP